MPPERSRQLIGNVWRYVTAATSGGGGGSQPPVPFVQSGDPGAVGTGAIWVDTGTDPPVLRVRNTADDGWVSGALGLATVLAASGDADGNLIENLASLAVIGAIQSGAIEAAHTVVEDSRITLVGGDGTTTRVQAVNDGALSVTPDDGYTAFVVNTPHASALAMDCGARPIVNLPTVDPAIAGALWNNGGVPAISTG